MASEVRVNQIQNRSGLGTITVADSGVVISGITTISDLRTSGGALTVGTGASISSPVTNVLTLGTNNTEVVRLTSSGKTGINNTNPLSTLSVGTRTTDISDSSLIFTAGGSSSGGEVLVATFCNTAAGASNNATAISFTCRSGDSQTAKIVAMQPNGSSSPNTQLDFYVYGNSGSTKVVTFDQNGRVTMPYQPAFCARNVGGGSALSGNIALNTIILNNGNHYSTSTGNFTAPIAGMYYFSFTGFTENSSSGSADISIQKNGTPVVRTYTSESTGTYRPFAVGCIVSLAANDTVRPNSGIELHGNLNPNFSGFLIG